MDIADLPRSAMSHSSGAVPWLSAAESIAVALKDSQDDVRIEALHAIKELNYKGTLDRVLEVLKDSNPEVRKSAVGLLGRIGGEEVVEPLINALKDQDDEVVKSAVRAMGELKDESFIEPLIATIKKNKSYNYEVLRVVKETGSKDDFKEALKRTIREGEYDVLSGGILAKMDRLFFSTLVELLESRSKRFQMNALQAIRDLEKRILDEELIKRVVAKLTAKDEEIVKRAAEAVKSIGVPAAIPLANIMEKTNTQTKSLLKKVFSDVRGLSILENMEKALKGPTKAARTVTTEAVTRFERLIGMVEGAIAEGTREVSRIVKESEKKVTDKTREKSSPKK